MSKPRKLVLGGGEIIKVDPDCYYCLPFEERDWPPVMTQERIVVLSHHQIEHDTRFYVEEKVNDERA